MLLVLAVAGILYGAFMASGQNDLKRLVAYTSISHMGFVLLGIGLRSLVALQGAVVGMLAHGLATGALFILAGSVQDRMHTRDLGRMGGFWGPAPRLALALLFFSMASLGLPGLGNFVGEFLSLLGAWRASQPLAALCSGGLILATIYTVRLLRSTVFGTPREREAPAELHWRERLVLASLAAGLFWLGLFPRAVLDLSTPSLRALQAAPSVAQANVRRRPDRRGRWAPYSMPGSPEAGREPPGLRAAAAGGGRGHGGGGAAGSCRAPQPPGGVPRHRCRPGCGSGQPGDFRPPGSREIHGLLFADGLSLLYTGLVLGAALLLVLLSYGYLRARPLPKEEYYALLLLTTLGAVVLAWAGHFAAFFLGLELLSVGLFVLIAYPRERPLSLEAGLKYLVLAGVSSAFVLFGLALIYYERGTMRLAGLASGGPFGALAWAGLAMVLVGLGFKLALVPFHLWTPDVFQGSPMPVAALIATISKGSMFALLLRALQPSLATGALALVLTILAVASMFAGNLLALLQGNLKRLLGYSSIAHVGYLLVAFLAGRSRRVGGRELLPAGLLPDQPGGVRGAVGPARHGGKGTAGAVARARPGAPAAAAGGHPRRGPAIAGRHPRSRPGSSASRPAGRGYPRPAVAAVDEPGGHERHRPVLLPAGWS